ncbi:MAG: hypothetical protein ACLFST_15440 [Spirochaetia bacterium]
MKKIFSIILIISAAAFLGAQEVRELGFLDGFGITVEKPYHLSSFKDGLISEGFSNSDRFGITGTDGNETDVRIVYDSENMGFSPKLYALLVIREYYGADDDPDQEEVISITYHTGDFGAGYWFAYRLGQESRTVYVRDMYDSPGFAKVMIFFPDPDVEDPIEQERVLRNLLPKIGISFYEAAG